MKTKYIKLKMVLNEDNEFMFDDHFREIMSALNTKYKRQHAQYMGTDHGYYLFLVIDEKLAVNLKLRFG